MPLLLNLALTTGTQDAKIRQLNFWKSVSGGAVKGTGAEIEVEMFLADVGTAPPYGDARRAVLEAIRGSALTGTTAGDREHEFWCN